MTKVTLPRTNQTGANEWSDVESNDNAIAEVVNGQLDNENIKANAGIVASKLASDAKPFTWYTPKVIATEESRESTSFGKLSTADEIASVVVPENGLVLVGFVAQVKSSVAAAGRAALFVGANQQKDVRGSAVEASTEGTGFTVVTTQAGGLVKNSTSEATIVTTGQAIGIEAKGGLCALFAAAGTYNLSVQYKATSGTVTAKERKLWVAVLGS